MAELTQVVSLSDVRTYLRYPAADTSDDDALANLFIPAATEAMVSLCGEIIPVQYDEYYDGGDFSVWLRNLPVLSVANVNEGWGWIDYDLDYVQVNTVPATSLFAFSVDDPETGEITRRSAGNVNIPFMPGAMNIRVTYTAGRAAVPGAVTLASLELIAYWWRNSQQRSSGSVTYDVADTNEARSGPFAGVTGINFGVPYGVVQMVRRWRKAPVIG